MATRKGHVKRIYKIAVNPDTKEEGIFTDIFVDVRRIDKMAIAYQEAGTGVEAQIVNHVFMWNDDPNNLIDGIDASNADSEGENANAHRKTSKRIIIDPDVPTDKNALPDGASNSATSIDDNNIVLWIVNNVKLQMPRGSVFAVGQVVQFAFNNHPLDNSEDAPSQTRKTTLMKIVNNDLDGMKMADPDGKNPKIVDWEVYREALKNGKTDPDDLLALCVEATDKFTIRFGTDVQTTIPYQNFTFVLTENKDDVETYFDEGDKDAKQIIRLDPLQVIVNVGSNIIAVEYAPEEK